MPENHPAQRLYPANRLYTVPWEDKMTSDTYNGWKNRQTWNVALWIGNDYGLYSAAVDFMRSYKGRRPYAAFIRHCGMQNERTPDNIAWFSTRLSYRELNAMMNEFKPEYMA